MPTYDYQCQSCGCEKEVFHGMNEAPEVSCESCEGRMKKQISRGSGIIFKGSGFYETDYKRTAKKEESSSGESKGHSCGTGCGCA